MNNRRYERGGVGSFFVVATVLALLFAGALLWAKNQGRSTQVASEPTTSQVTQNPASEDDKNSATNDVAVPSQSDGSQQKTSDSSPTTTSNTGSSSSTTNSGQGSTSSKPSSAPLSNTNTDAVVSTGPSVDQIPEAGPAEVFATVIAMSAVSATLYILVQSQKRVRLSALK